MLSVKVTTSATAGGLDGFIQRYKQATQDIAMEEAKEIVEDIQDDMRQPKHGRIYRRGSGEYQASAPGESPAIDTQALADSIVAVPVGTTSAKVTATDGKAPWLEFGTSNMAARPFMRPARLRHRGHLARRLREKMGGSIS